MTLSITLFARLNKAGTHVVCGILNCGARLCRVSEPWAEKHVDTPDGHTTIRLGPEDGPKIPGRHLVFDIGWLPDDRGIWRVTEHAAERTRLDKTPFYRKPPVRYLGGERRHGPMTPPQLPIVARCPSPECGALQTLDAEHLGIVAVQPNQRSRGVFPPEK